MNRSFSDRLRHNRLNRRDTAWLFAASLVAPALQGCATSPVSGESILVGMSEDDERDVDRQHAPHQFSSDFGAVPMPEVNAYVAEVGRRVQAVSHRPKMPYSVRVVQANHVNAYTFPAGAMGVTRGIMVQLQNEAELAALLGHEVGHVNARHAAQRQGSALVVELATLAVAVAASASDSAWAPLWGLGATLGGSALLASYSRDNEREADALGQRYLVAAGYPASGMVKLHQMLLDQHDESPGLLETMFSSHPMSRERRDTAARLAETQYAASRSRSAQRERFMDRTAALRELQPTIEACQQGESLMMRKQWGAAEEQFNTALDDTPDDYPSLLRMGQCLKAQRRQREALRYAQLARQAMPREAQAVKFAATLKMGLKQHDAALADLELFDRLLPGDPGTVFLKGVNLEGQGRRREAAEAFRRFLKNGSEGDAAQYATTRLKAWGELR